MTKAQALEPKIRFDEYGCAAESSYESKSFEDIFVFSTGKNIKQAEASPDFATPCVRYGELYHMYAEVITTIINRTNVDVADLKFSDGDEILLPSAGEDPLDIGSASALTIKEVAIGRTINVLKPKEPEVYDQKFASYYINQKLKKKISTLARGASISNVYNSDLRKLEIHLPTLPEQRKIADFLTAVDGRIQQLSQKKALLEDYKKGVMQQLFTQALRFKDDHGNDFPEWEEKTLGELLSFKNGFNAEKSQYGTGVKFINVLDVLTPRPISHDTIIGRVEIPAKDFSKFEVKYGDLLFQRSSETREDVGQANVYVDQGQSAGFGGFVIRGHPKTEFNPLFMNYLLRTPLARNEITTKSGGSTRYNVSQETLGETRVVMPSSIPEQTKIANFLSVLDRKIESVATQIAETQTFKRGLLQQMFV
jgi:type I restriction enzyme S subunit